MTMNDPQRFVTPAEVKEMLARLQQELLPQIPDLVKQAIAAKVEPMRQEVVTRAFLQGLNYQKEIN